MESVLNLLCVFFLIQNVSNSTDTEERWDVIGRVDDILFVVYTERNDRTRIISARKATKEEIDEYYDDYDLR